MFSRRWLGPLTLVILFAPAPIAAQSWNQLSPSGGPPPARVFPSGVLDTSTKQMIIFGGNNATTYFNDVWSLKLGNSPQWPAVAPSGTPPPARSTLTAVYDQKSSRMTIFGGYSGTCYNDAWVLENSNGLNGTPTWIQLQATGTTPPRNDHTAVYDPGSNRMIVFGGVTYGASNCSSASTASDVWVLTNANGADSTAPAWTQLTPAGTAPPVRANHTAVYDSGSNTMIIFGGNGNGADLNDTWVLSNANGLGGTPTWRQISFSGAVPAARHSHTAVYDPATNRMIIAGGVGQTTKYADTWVLQNANGQGATPAWVQLSSVNAQPARQASAAVYDSTSNQMFVFGGTDGTSILNDTWSLTDGNGNAFQQVPGALKQLSVGANGTLWGINSSGEIYMFNSQSQSFTSVGGTLAQIAVDANGSFWGLNPGGSVYHWNPSAQDYDIVPGNLAQLAVGADGDVWGLNSGGLIYHFNNATNSLDNVPGVLSSIAVGFSGAVWGVNASGLVYRYNPGTQNFQEVSGSLTQIAVGADGDVWGLDNGNVLHFNRLTQSWESVPGALSQITVGSAGNVWGLNASGNIYQFNAQSRNWNQFSGSLTEIVAAENGTVWGINGSEQIYELSGPTQPTQMFHYLPGGLSQLSVGVDGDVWGLNNAGQIFRFNPSIQDWTQMPGALSKLAVGFRWKRVGLKQRGTDLAL